MPSSRVLRLLALGACMLLSVSLLDFVAPVSSVMAEGNGGAVPPPPVPGDSIEGERAGAPDSTSWSDAPTDETDCFAFWQAIIQTTVAVL